MYEKPTATASCLEYNAQVGVCDQPTCAVLSKSMGISLNLNSFGTLQDEWTMNGLWMDLAGKDRKDSILSWLILTHTCWHCRSLCSITSVKNTGSKNAEDPGKRQTLQHVATHRAESKAANSRCLLWYWIASSYCPQDGHGCQAQDSVGVTTTQPWPWLASYSPQKYVDQLMLAVLCQFHPQISVLCKWHKQGSRRTIAFHPSFQPLNSEWPWARRDFFIHTWKRSLPSIWSITQ